MDLHCEPSLPVKVRGLNVRADVAANRARRQQWHRSKHGTTPALERMEAGKHPRRRGERCGRRASVPQEAKHLEGASRRGTSRFSRRRLREALLVSVEGGLQGGLQTRNEKGDLKSGPFSKGASSPLRSPPSKPLREVRSPLRRRGSQIIPVEVFNMIVQAVPLFHLRNSIAKFGKHANSN